MHCAAMIHSLSKYQHSLAAKLILMLGLTLLLSISTWAFFNIRVQKQKVMDQVLSGADRLGTTIRLGAHYAMMLNAREEINQIITNVSRQPDIVNVRIYNKAGQIKFSNQPEEVDQRTNIKAEACDICHRSDPPLVDLELAERTRIFKARDDERFLGIISPIHNEPSCSADACHVHPGNKQILGALDVVISLAEVDRDILRFEQSIIQLTAIGFLLTASIIFLFLHLFVRRPIRRIIAGTREIARGNYAEALEVRQQDELGELAQAITAMGKRIEQKQTALNRQRDEYQNLFDHVPCIITVQDRDYRLIGFNREFYERFDPRPGDYCFCAYKGRSSKCPSCPVERTFADGGSYTSEESGINKDGTAAHWIVKTAPLRDASGEIVAAMEMSIDITSRKRLEEQLEHSERKYHAIFSNIPNPVFVLAMSDLRILDCNSSVTPVYGCERQEIVGQSFLEFFRVEERADYERRLRACETINQARQIHRGGRVLYVNIRVSPSQYPGQRVLLVTTSDITQRLEAEQQLIQASKMATLGEMATGVAHELNQPLSVIKTASNFFVKKIDRGETIDGAILATLAREISSHVDRATRIITHMRQFGRKSELELTLVQVNEVLRSAHEIFSQQLRVRGIAVTWEIDPDLPLITADPGRLEQVFINLMLNARDAITEKRAASADSATSEAITLGTRCQQGQVIVTVGDTGIGLPPHMADKIFEPFFTTKKVGEGTGLGLSISYGIVKECGGTIRAVPVEQGALFELRFPVAKEQS
jgi:histidine kinase